MKTITCECGQEIAFGLIEVTEKFGLGVAEKRVPVENRTPIYRIVREGADGTPILRRIYPSDGPAQSVAAEYDRLVVNHFRTCPKAGEFTKR